MDVLVAVPRKQNPTPAAPKSCGQRITNSEGQSRLTGENPNEHSGRKTEQLRRLQSPRHHPRRLGPQGNQNRRRRSEEHTSELQSRENLVCRLLLEKIN